MGLAWCNTEKTMGKVSKARRNQENKPPIKANLREAHSKRSFRKCELLEILFECWSELENFIFFKTNFACSDQACFLQYIFLHSSQALSDFEILKQTGKKVSLLEGGEVILDKKKCFL